MQLRTHTEHVIWYFTQQQILVYIIDTLHIPSIVFRYSFSI